MRSLPLLCVSVVIFIGALTATRTPPLPATSAELGKLLFFDPILSGNRQMSCASCHKPDFAFADSATYSPGTGNNVTTRNTPSIMYASKQLHFFWDGRAKSLEEQALGPITNPAEMNLPVQQAVDRLRQDPFYSQAFDAVFQAEPDVSTMCKSLADFERTLSTYDSPYDRFLKGDQTAMSEAAQRGMGVYLTSNCKECHGIEGTFALHKLANIGLYKNVGKDDPGRFKVSRDSADLGRFKVPSLRNVARTAPYMHDGSLRTLREVVMFYNNPVNFAKSRNVDPAMFKQERPMLPDEINDLLVFFDALTDSQYAK